MGDNLADSGARVEEGQATLRWLRRLVTGLALAMGAGILAIAAVLWVRLGAAPPAPLPVLPAGLALPEGVRPAAVTFAKDWLVVVSEAGEVLVFDAAGALRQRVMPDQP